MTQRIKLLFITILLAAFGFMGATTLYDNLTDSAPERPFFVEDQSLDQQTAPQTISLTETDLDTTAGQEAPTFLSERERIMAEVYNRVSPSVVSINVTQRVETFQGFEDEFASSGSGFVIDKDGHIVTNFHVVDGATEIVVNFVDGTIVRAEVIGLDPDADLAVLQVDMPVERLVPVKFGSEKELVIGQSVVAIGSPFGQRWTMTAGIVSALDRDIEGLAGYRVGSVIQTDAPINPGNSGGPLLNLAGEVIGVNAQIRSDSRANSGVGFAIPATLVQRVTRELIENGSVDYSFIGISGGDIDINIIEQFDLANNQQGFVISGIVTGSPADRAGLRSATNDSIDIITAVDGIPVNNFASLIGYLAEKTRPGDTVTATILRDGELVDVPITLSSRP